MKKFAFSLIASFALIQSAHGATTALVESLLEYTAITNALGDPVQTIIPPQEFVIDIKRITKQINVLGEVRYKIVTRRPWDSFWWDVERSDCSHHHNRHYHDNTNLYIATLLVSPNPGIGPNIITVLSIVKVDD